VSTVSRSQGRAGGFPVAGPSKGPDRSRSMRHRNKDLFAASEPLNIEHRMWDHEVFLTSAVRHSGFDIRYSETGDADLLTRCCQKPEAKDILQDLSNLHCLPGRAGGSPKGLVTTSRHPLCFAHDEAVSGSIPRPSGAFVTNKLGLFDPEQHSATMVLRLFSVTRGSASSGHRIVSDRRGERTRWQR
jgi:hypothetical protein